MATLAPSPPGRLILPGASSIAWPLAGIAVMAFAHLYLALNRAVNWDEFFHFSQVHQFAAGRSLQPLQTLHARMFAWSLEIPGGPIEQLRAIRLVMLGMVLATAGSIYLVAERFAPRTVALTCALMYLSAGFVLQHGTSFRADAIIAALLTASLAIVARAPLRAAAIVGAGALCALATLESIKTVLYAPAFLSLAWLRWRASGYGAQTAIRLVAIGVVAGVLFLAFYIWHNPVAEAVGPAPASAATVVRNSGHKMFALGALPYHAFILKAVLLALVFAAAVVMTPFLLARGGAQSRPERIALAGLWLPITVVSFYHNTAPYFYVFILAPVAAGCAPAVARFIGRYSLRAVCAVLVVSAFALLAAEDRRALDNQRAIIAAAEETFGGPVAYFDYPAMMSAWPKANHFMTPWGQDAYLAGSAPSFREIMGWQAVPLVIENSPDFEQLFRTDEKSYAFLPDDAAALRANYIRHWGPLMIAGRIVPGDGALRTSEFLVPGRYTVQGAPLEFDGQDYAPGEVVPVARGRHRLRATSGREAKLVWGDSPGTPSMPPPTGPFWAGF